MNIRARITLLFIGLVVVILSISSIAIYLSSANHRQEDFYTRLANKATNTATLLIEVDEIDAERLFEMEQNNPASLPNELIKIFNYKNEILYNSDPEGILKVDEELLNNIRLNTEVRLKQGPYEMLGLLYTGRYDRFVVIIAAIDIFGRRKTKNLQTILLVTFVSSIIVVSISGWFYSGRVLKPISGVINQVENITETSLNLRVNEGTEDDEIRRLATTFNRMLNRIETAFDAQRHFIANASHELRTPLTAITGKLEVILLQSRSPEQYKEALQQLLFEVKKLNKLSNRLLLLAQASTDHTTQFLSAIRIDEILWEAKKDILQANETYSVNISFDLELDDDLMTVPGDEQLVKVALANLMENGCKYSPDHEVNVTVKAANNELVLQFTDSGIGIPKEAFDHITEPFYRAQNTLQIPGHGIGLSLVFHIIKSHRGRISFTSVLHEGTTFTVSLPLKPAASDPHF